MKKLNLNLGLMLIGLCVLGLAGQSLAKNSSSWSQYRLGIAQWGPVHVGMTLKQAAQALKTPVTLSNEPETGATCAYAHLSKIKTVPIIFMVNQTKIVRIDVIRPGIQTTQGAQVGMTEAQIKKLYPSIQSERHHYDERGHYLIYRSKQPNLHPYTLLFETDGRKVTQFRSGYDEPVNYVEGCL